MKYSMVHFGMVPSGILWTVSFELVPFGMVWTGMVP